VTDTQIQAEIRAALEVVDPDTFDAGIEAQRRIDFLADYLLRTGARGYVLGVSGGVDSSAAARLAQLACEQVRGQGSPATFVAVRLPYRVQRDEDDAQRALAFIRPDEVLTVDIGPGVDAHWEQVLAAGVLDGTGQGADPGMDPGYHVGNVKARHRMVTQYAIAGVRGLLVIGTDHAAEAVTGFYTKFGDGACDLTPLFGLPKRRVRQICRHLGADAAIVDKVPTADLESDRPLLADEVALGVTYQAIDDYLEGRAVSEQDEATIVGWYRRTAHKRALPVTPP
jgi:NAD+ synthase